MSGLSTFNVVTGAIGYIGRYIAQVLLDRGQQVRTIPTHHDKPHPFGNEVKAFSYGFDEPTALVDHLHGARSCRSKLGDRKPLDRSPQPQMQILLPMKFRFPTCRQVGTDLGGRIRTARCHEPSSSSKTRNGIRNTERFESSFQVTTSSNMLKVDSEPASWTLVKQWIKKAQNPKWTWMDIFDDPR